MIRWYMHEKDYEDILKWCKPSSMTTLAQGILSGRVTKQTGNFMPVVDTNLTGKASVDSMSVPVVVFAGKVNPKGDYPAPVAIVQSNTKGKYSLNLDPGTYTVVIHRNAEYYLNRYGSGSVWDTVVVSPGATTTYDIVDSSEAVF